MSFVSQVIAADEVFHLDTFPYDVVLNSALVSSLQQKKRNGKVK